MRIYIDKGTNNFIFLSFTKKKTDVIPMREKEKWDKAAENGRKGEEFIVYIRFFHFHFFIRTNHFLHAIGYLFSTPIFALHFFYFIFWLLAWLVWLLIAGCPEASHDGAGSRARWGEVRAVWKVSVIVAWKIYMYIYI